MISSLTFVLLHLNLVLNLNSTWFFCEGIPYASSLVSFVYSTLKLQDTRSHEAMIVKLLLYMQASSNMLKPKNTEVPGMLKKLFQKRTLLGNQPC